jgi:type II secretion system protein I
VRARESGFTLIEVLVALAVLGTVLATAFGMVSGQLRRIARADEQVTLALFAQNLLARVDTGLGQAPSASGSTADGLRWTVLRSPYRLPPLPPRSRGGGSGTDGGERQGSMLEKALGSDREPGSSEGTGQEESQSAEGRSLGEPRGSEASGSPGGGNQPPPQLWLIRVVVENARGERFFADTLRLEARS